MSTNEQTIQISPADIAKLVNNHSGSVNFGPLSITWNIDISVPEITVDATLHGTPIGHAVINKEHPVATLGGNVGIAKADIILTAAFATKELDYHVDLTVVGIKIVNKGGKLFSW